MNDWREVKKQFDAENWTSTGAALDYLTAHADEVEPATAMMIKFSWVHNDGNPWHWCYNCDWWWRSEESLATHECYRNEPGDREIVP